MRLKASVILCTVGLVLVVLGMAISRMGNHDLAHLFGMAGVTLGLTVAMRARGRFGITILGSRGVTAAQALLGLAVVIVITNRLGYLSIGSSGAVFTILILLAGISWIARQLSGEGGNIRWEPFVAMNMTLAVSWVWEGIIQPHVTVYGGPPSGSVNGWQVFADFIGAIVGWRLAIYIITVFEGSTPGGAEIWRLLRRRLLLQLGNLTIRNEKRN